MKLLSLMTFIGFAVKFLQTDTPDSGSSDLLTKLLELHRYHCGETATCGSSEHVEPTEYQIPVPCCVPCSCLPSCIEHQNCCPVLTNLTQLPSVTKSSTDKRELESGTITADNQSILETMNLTNANKTDEHRLDLNNMDTFHTEKSTDFETKEILKVNESGRISEKCTRPQLLYIPNRYLDSPAYLMVTTCPEGFEDKLAIEKCHAGIDGVELLDLIPVTSKLSGLTYKNKHCLYCNEKLQPGHAIEWITEVVSKGIFRSHIFFPSPDLIFDTLNMNIIESSNIHFKPGAEGLARRCWAYDISTCNQTGHWDVYDDLIETLCLDGQLLPVISTINRQLFTFKNIACLHCNTDKDGRENKLSCGYYNDQGQPARVFSVTLNLGSVVIDDQNKKHVVPAPYIEQDVFQLLPQRGCPSGKIYIQGRCRGIICPRDHYIKENQCVPLYDKIKGLDLHIQIQVTPSRAIPKLISEVFVNQLKDAAERVLSDTVQLERRQVSLLYLPRSKANLTQYYLFDAFLFSPSNVIDYSTAVEQIKEFIFKLKTDVKLAMLELSNIKLDFKFKHGVEQRINRYIDMSNGKALIPLMKKGWALMTPGPYMTISEINWCFRTVIDSSETEEYGNYIRVKSTDILLYIYQIDSLKTQVYACLDLFIQRNNIEENFQKNQKEQTLIGDEIDNKATLSGEIVVDSERGLIVTVTLIAVILLLVVLYRRKAVMARKHVEESTSSNQSPSDNMELNVLSSGRNTAENMKMDDLHIENNTDTNRIQTNEASVNMETECK